MTIVSQLYPDSAPPIPPVPPMALKDVVLEFGPDPAPVPPAAPVSRKRDPSLKEEQRKDMLAKVHMAKQHLMRMDGWTDDVYRYSLSEKFGVTSAAKLTHHQLHQALLWLQELGWKAKPGRHHKGAPRALDHDDSSLSREALLSKIEAQLAEKGRVEGTDMPWGYAVGILKRQSNGVTKCLDHADREQLKAVIAALDRDAKRKGRERRGHIVDL
jgi:hypothetical protein